MTKTYNFTCEMKSTGRGYVEADSIDEAKEKILNGEYEDIYDEYDTEILSVNEVEEQ